MALIFISGGEALRSTVTSHGNVTQTIPNTYPNLFISFNDEEIYPTLLLSCSDNNVSIASLLLLRGEVSSLGYIFY